MIQLGKYTLHEELGRGGYGIVYRAIDNTLEVERAVKLLHPGLAADMSFIERFRREAQITARLEHPHIVPVYEVDERDGRYFLVMKYMAGGSVKDLLEKKGRLTFEKALEITRQAGSALEKAHREGLVHRDVKPGNILLEENGTARLADFSFSKAMQSASGASLSMTGGMVGTPAYMAPELWDKKEAGPTSDLYSLVCVFYEMMLGRALFDGETPSELMKQHIMDRPQYPQRWPQGVPGGIEGVLEKALAKEAGKRHGSVTVFLGELRELSRGDRINFQQERRAASQTEKNGRSVKGAAGSMMPALPAALSVIWRGWR